jgi:hypothetical protein
LRVALFRIRKCGEHVFAKIKIIPVIIQCRLVKDFTKIVII